MKNPYGKTRKKDNPYFVIEQHGWVWRVLKLYQAPAASTKNHFSRAFCLVSSPHCPGGELGDVYVRDVPGLTMLLAEA